MYLISRELFVGEKAALKLHRFNQYTVHGSFHMRNHMGNKLVVSCIYVLDTSYSIHVIKYRL